MRKLTSVRQILATYFPFAKAITRYFKPLSAPAPP
jgi:hypothetical protein